VLTLALGIGMNTAIFSLIDQLLLWTVPAHEPKQSVKIAFSAYPLCPLLLACSWGWRRLCWPRLSPLSEQ